MASFTEVARQGSALEVGRARGPAVRVGLALAATAVLFLAGVVAAGAVSTAPDAGVMEVEG